jgi:hypothetical protein
MADDSTQYWRLTASEQEIHRAPRSSNIRAPLARLTYIARFYIQAQNWISADNMFGVVGATVQHRQDFDSLTVEQSMRAGA